MMAETGQKLMEQALKNMGGDIVHHFGAGVYAKETYIPAGVELTQHTHSFDHLSILASGTVLVHAGDVVTEKTGPACLTIAAGIAHKVVALTDTVWFCVHATNETDHEQVDAQILGGN